MKTYLVSFILIVMALILLLYYKNNENKKNNKRIPYKTLMENTKISKVAQKQFIDEDTTNTYTISIYKYDPPLVFTDIELCTNMYEIKLDTVENLKYSVASCNSIEWMMHLYDEEGKQKIRERIQNNPSDDRLAKIQARTNANVIKWVLDMYAITNYFNIIIEADNHKYAKSYISMKISNEIAFTSNFYIFENGKWRLTYKNTPKELIYYFGTISNIAKKEGIDALLNKIDTLKINPDGTVSFEQ